MGIAGYFTVLLARIQPDPSTVETAERRLGEVRTCLRLSMGLKNLLRVGSFSRDTFIRRGSDVDGFAILSRESVRWGDRYKTSDTVLDGLRERLRARYVRTPVIRDGPAVVVQFADCNVDVVPAIFWEARQDGWPIYMMPTGTGDWQRASPERHNAYIREMNLRAGGKIRKTAQLLKLWRECRTPRVPLSSFHLEMLLAVEGVCVGAKSYAECVTDALRLLSQRSCRALQDPLGISGYIPALKTSAQAAAALASVRYSREHAEEALAAEARRDLREARRQWNIVFNGRFPGAPA